MQVVVNGPHHHLAGVEPDAQLQQHPVRAPHLVGIGPDGALHGQGGIAGAQGVVLVGNGGTKERHNAIAQHLVDGTLEAVHGVHHQMNGRIEELLGGFGVEALNEPGGVLEVGKEHGDLLALAFQGRAGREDLLGQVGRRVGERCWAGVLSGRAGAVGAGAAVSPVQTRTPSCIIALSLARNEFVFQIFQGCIVEAELPLEGADRSSGPPLEHSYRLVEDLLKGHRPSSL